MQQVYVLFRDGEVFECHLDYNMAEEHLELNVEADTEQVHTWSITPFNLLSDRPTHA